jgi:hypothetical protein
MVYNPPTADKFIVPVFFIWITLRDSQNKQSCDKTFFLSSFVTRFVCRENKLENAFCLFLSTNLFRSFVLSFVCSFVRLFYLSFVSFYQRISSFRSFFRYLTSFSLPGCIKGGMHLKIVSFERGDKVERKPIYFEFRFYTIHPHTASSTT